MWDPAPTPATSSSVARIEPEAPPRPRGGSTVGLSHWERWLEFCTRIDGFPRHLSIHSGGMLVTAAPLIDIAPIEKATMPDRVVVQFDKRDVETLKLIKLDLLGLGMLAAMDETLQLIEHDCGVCLDLDRLPEEVPEVFAMLQAADTVGVFQVESRAQMQTLPKSKPKSLDDLGSQGEAPTHPELLDWLAVEFMDSGWDVKHLVRLLATSGTYRQSSQPRDDLKERDPYNRLLARQARFRLDAEIVRDTALEVSGLLSRQVGGPSVKPYQPAGYWAALNFPPREWQNDHGERLYRRSLYTHWQRSFPHPSLLAFDAPSREECTVERPRSNIPQQALVLLNDPTYVEAARVFAARIIKEGGASDGDRLSWAYRQALSRAPNGEEQAILNDLLAKHTQHYTQDAKAAEQLVKTGESPVPADIPTPQLAAWTSVARAMLNLHETITRN